MPPEPLPIDRKDFLKDRKPSASEPVEVLPARWRDSPTTPSSHYHTRGSPSPCRWAGGGDFRRPFSGHGRSVGGWHTTSVESGLPVSVESGNPKDPKRGNSREASASPNGNSHPQTDFVNPCDQLQLNDQHGKSSGDGVGTAGDQRLEKAVSLGSSLDWKPLKWIRSGSLTSRGSGFSHLSSCKVIGVDPLDTKMEVQPGAVTLLQSPSGDASTCATPNTPDEANSRKKPRLGWGEGLAKYEKKKVDPDDIVDKENGSRNEMVNGVSSSESLLPTSSSFPGKSPSLTGNSESASPVTSCSFACSLSPGLEEKTEKASIVETTVDNDTCNPGVALSQNLTHGLTFNLENFDLAEDFNLSSSLDQLLQTDAITPGSGFAMEKLQVWKADISRTIEIAESEIDSLEHELKSLISDEGSCFVPVIKRCNNSNTVDLRNKSSVDIPKAEHFKDHNCRDGSQVSTGSICTVSVGSAVYLGRDGKLYDSILATNKVIASRTSDELSKLLPKTNSCTDIVRSTSTDDSLIKKRISMRKRFLKFKERAITLKFKAFQYSWKESLRLLSVRSGAKSQKKFESSSRLGYIDSQKHRISNHSRSSTPGGCLRLVPTKEVVEYVNKLLLDSRVKTYRNVQKMPTFILNKRERMGSRFISDNGLVEDPIDVEKQRAVVNLWTEEDKQMFLDNYALFGKNFKKIASFFQHKTVADCVEFYYKNHKSESFQKTKKNSKFAKGKSCDINTNSTYLVTHGKRPNRETGATSLDMLGAASAMVANVNERSNDFTIYCNEQETVAADVLAGICGSISSEALGSCITSSVDHPKLGRSSLNDVDEETCSDDSCGEDTNMNSSIWTDEERSSFIKAVKSYGKDFSMISRCLGTRSSDQCKAFFSKVKKRFGLDAMNRGVGGEGTTGPDLGGGDQDDTLMVDSGSGISNDKSSMECKMDAEDLHSSDLREEHAESDRNAAPGCTESELVIEDKVEGNLEGAADSEAANLEESVQNTCSDSASGAKVEEHETVAKTCPSEDLNSVSFYSRGSSLNLTIDHGSTLDLNTASENVTCQETGNGFVMSNLFPQDPIPQRKTVSCQDDVSSRLTFRRSGQRSSSIDGYQLNLHKRSLSSNEPQSNLKLDESLLLPIDGCIQMGTDLTPVSQQQRRSSSLEIEKTNKSGDVKLFGQIITNHSLPKSNGSAQENKKPDAGKSYNLKFDQSNTKEYSNDLQLKRNYGFWEGNRIQTGYSSLPGSAMLLAKYPAAFSNVSTLPKLDQHQHNRGPGYHAYSQPFTVDKLLPEMPRRKEFEALSTSVGGMNVVGGACNGVSDPVAAIRMHYAKTEQYKNGGAESWRSNVSDIGSR
ncbi:putative transcription factor MYB-HB-like family [Helianthus annuus]|uniref:Putative SANT/Myb domain, Homeodomain-like protein n=1 Tax=Helianthus annuus TaxID=4232 RepID=A0A251SMH7_HELAN|nr:putative transcription factor MYB/SANT family [Helianthus annuus]KAJ0661358.1 putative transcription factor MYB/SANT family [Helianthus annuus]KAJ0841984.1 putative transcription factor MYB/SANT family [Helianthus annuus]KAJ0855534.1 putative transcription factor MYB-HB-like family [Helianthus annuus]